MLKSLLLLSLIFSFSCTKRNTSRMPASIYLDDADLREAKASLYEKLAKPDASDLDVPEELRSHVVKSIESIKYESQFDIIDSLFEKRIFDKGILEAALLVRNLKDLKFFNDHFFMIVVAL